MNSDLVFKKDMISKGDVPRGYKKSEVGIIPGTWSIKKLSEYIATLNNGISINAGDREANDNEKGILKTSSISNEGFKPEENKVILNEKDIDSLKVYPQKGNLIVVRKNTPELVGLVNYIEKDYKNLFLPDLLWQTVFKPNCKINIKYLAYFLNTNYYYRIIKTLATGSSNSFPNIRKENFLNISVAIPNEYEQNQIVNILENADKIIELKEKLLQEKQKQKKGLLERLLTGKVRLNGFNEEIKVTKLKKYISEIKEKNKDNKENRILSVTNKQGFILQEEQFDRIVASSDVSNYKIVKKGEFAYNPSRVNVGSIDLLTRFDSGLLSPMYVIFECKEELNNDYLYQFLKSDLFLNYIPRLLQGSVRDSLSFDALQQVKLFIPSLDEQKQISKLLMAADNEIDLLKKEIELLKEQKKGLMQLLLTGIVRVKCD